VEKVYAIIVTYNGLKWYDRCLGSLRKQTVKVTPVVIDNGSSDGTVDYIREHFPEAYVIDAKENLGFAKANNVGLKYALEQKADYVLLLNHDAWFTTDDGLERMIAQAEKHPEYWIVAPLQVYASSGRIESETERHLQCSCTPDYDFMSDSLRGTLQDIYPSEYSCAYCWLLPRKTIETIGGFDPLFYHYGEDDNYQQRVRYHGGMVGVCPKVEVAHDIENRSADFRDKNLDWRKYLIIKFGDINMNWNVDSHLKRLKKQLLFMYLRVQRKHINETLKEYKYWKSIKQQIAYSRNTNKTIGNHWLYL